MRRIAEILFLQLIVVQKSLVVEMHQLAEGAQIAAGRGNGAGDRVAGILLDAVFRRQNIRLAHFRGFAGAVLRHYVAQGGQTQHVLAQRDLLRLGERPAGGQRVVILAR